MVQLLVALLTFALAGGAEAEVTATVTRHVDGDTFYVSFHGQDPVKLRLVGVDTPETRHPTKPIQCYGPQASHFISSFLPVGTEVRILADWPFKDRYDRLLAYVYTQTIDGWINVNEFLVRRGFARASHRFNYAHKQRHLELESTAQQEQAGLWGACEE